MPEFTIEIYKHQTSAISFNIIANNKDDARDICRGLAEQIPPDRWAHLDPEFASDEIEESKATGEIINVSNRIQIPDDLDNIPVRIEI